jgi:PTS system nitrogen regulatory IIA component
MATAGRGGLSGLHFAHPCIRSDASRNLRAAGGLTHHSQATLSSLPAQARLHRGRGPFLLAEWEHSMGIADRLSAADVVLELDAPSKRSLLRMLAADAAGRLGRSEREILDALEAREELGSTALGRGVALPHARLAGDHPPVMRFARLRRPIDYEAKDDEAVDLVILVLWPEAAPEGFLPALSETCRALREPQALRQLRMAKSAEEVVALLHRYGQPFPSVPGGV